MVIYYENLHGDLYLQGNVTSLSIRMHTVYLRSASVVHYFTTDNTHTHSDIHSILPNQQLWNTKKQLVPRSEENMTSDFCNLWPL